MRWFFAMAIIALAANSARAEPKVRLDCDQQGTITYLAWDTEGGSRTDRNLLRAPVLGATGRGNGQGGFELTTVALDARLPFDPKVTPTCVIPANWSADGSFALPAIVNAPDFGPMVFRQTAGSPAVGRLEGSRAEKRVDLILHTVAGARFTFEPLLLEPPVGLKDVSLWPLARRGWLNAVQPTSQWGEQDRPFSAPAGVLGNNVISDPASLSLWFYADQCFFIPEPAPGISLMPTLRRSIDYWLDHKIKPDGEMVGYWEYGGFLDANAAPLIAAWDYVEISRDRDWLSSKTEKLEKVADYLLARDIDHDGLIEAKQSGNYNALQQPARSCAWWDALNCGHKDGWTNAITYRALCCMADLERQLGHDDKATRYAQQAGQLRASYFPTLFNEKTGLLAWWKSADGTLHDYASPTTCGLAIEYGLVPADRAGSMLARLWKKIDEVKFTRFDLGVPPMLLPVQRADYLQPSAIGLPQKPDGSDTFGIYMNGGITAGQVLHFINATRQFGDPARADMLLKAMLTRQQKGGFQNGVTDTAMAGIDWTTWDGKPSGYEGYLADNFRFLQAIPLGEPALRQRLYRPMAGK